MSPAGAASRKAADELMTAEREETKYLLPLDRVAAVVDELDQQLPSHRFSGEDANRLPDPHHFVTTVYFDTPSRSQYRAAVTEVDRNVKVRGKEYYDVHPSLAEVATDPAELLHYQPWLWFELKERVGAKTFKRRFRLAKREVPAFFARTRETVASVANLPSSDAEVPPSSVRETAASGLDSFAQYCRDLAEPLVASCLVNYRRLSWQADDGTLRVTLDLGLSFFRPANDLWTQGEPLHRGALGVPAATQRQAVLEVKSRALIPEWLGHALDRAGVEASRFSKFVAASRAVHGDG